MKFTEIFRLKKMLEKANIPFQFSKKFGGFHIVYSFEWKVVCSVVEHEFSYGREKDLLEIQGLMTEQEMEEEQGTVLGYLTADNVFGRIKNHWTSSKGEIEKEADKFIKENSYATCESRVPGNPMSDSIVVWHEPSAKMSFVEGFKRGQNKIEQLTEAKEIIKDLLDTQYRLDPYLEVFKARIKRAEDFISGVRVTKKTPQTEDCTTCIYRDGACYPSTTIFDKNKKCKSYVKEKSIQKTGQEENA